MGKINLAITGCMGRMGQQLIKSANKDRSIKLVALTENRIIKKKINGINVALNTNKAFKNTNLIIDFTVPKCTFEVLKIAKKAHLALGCKGVTRTDFKFYKNKFYILELNTQPGMTSLSLVPEIANYKGISFPDLVEKILLDASCNK